MKPWLYACQHSGYNIGIMGRRYKVNVMRTFFLKLEHYFTEPFRCYFLAVAVTAYGHILAEYTFQRTAGKEYSSCASAVRSGNARLFSEVE